MQIRPTPPLASNPVPNPPHLICKSLSIAPLAILLPVSGQMCEGRKDLEELNPWEWVLGVGTMLEPRCALDNMTSS